MSPYPQFRPDLLIQSQAGPRSDKQVFRVIDPINAAHYEFDAQTLALFQSFDGQSNCNSITSAFNARHLTTLTPKDVERFLNQALANELIRPGTQPFTFDDYESPVEDSTPAASVGISVASEEFNPLPSGSEGWVLADPNTFFVGLAKLLRPLRLLFLLLVLSLTVLVPVAVYTLFQNQPAMQQDLAYIDQSSSYLWRFIFSLLLISLLRCLVQGTLIAYYGGQVNSFGLRLVYGILPRFHIDNSAISNFNRSARLWTWGSNLLFRFALLVLGSLGWFVLRDSGSQLALTALVISHTALLTILLVSLPWRPSDGYRWLMTVLQLPLSTLKTALYVTRARFTGKPLPTGIDAARARRLLFYGIALTGIWAWAFVRITDHIVGLLIETFPAIFGQATHVIILTGVLLLILRWIMRQFVRRQSVTPGRTEPVDHEIPLSHVQTQKSPVSRYFKKLLVLILLVLILMLPLPYRPGGKVVLLPPEQQAIQAPIAGRLIDVGYRGGDGGLIKEGDTIAVIQAVELASEIAAMREEIAEQQAQLAQRQNHLQQLLGGERTETIAAARARVEGAELAAQLARKQLETAQVASEYSDREVDRINELPPGLISELELSRSEKQAAIDRQRIGELIVTVAAKGKELTEAKAQLELLENGPTPEEIEIARQQVVEAEAASRRLRQLLADSQEQMSGAQLRMPFTGYLVDPHLKQKVGMFLDQGATFAMAQAKIKPIVEMIIPEAEVADVEIEASAEIRLMSYPLHPFHGRVVAIEPTGSESDFGQTFSLLIEFSNTATTPLKPGMSGYGKINSGTKPLYIQLSQPLTRFAAIEVWSWIP